MTTFEPVEPDTEKRLTSAARRAETSKRARDAEIVVAFIAGAGIREIARAVNLTHPTVKAILDRNAENPEIIEEWKKRQAKRELNERLNRQRTSEATDRK